MAEKFRERDAATDCFEAERRKLLVGQVPEIHGGKAVKRLHETRQIAFCSYRKNKKRFLTKKHRFLFFWHHPSPVIPFDQIDERLEQIGKDRVWLAASTPYSADYIRTVMAPNSKRRTARVNRVLSDAIEAEAAKQNLERIPTESAPEIPAGHTAIYLSGEALTRAERASRMGPWDTLGDFCRDAIKSQADAILKTQEESPPANGTTGP